MRKTRGLFRHPLRTDSLFTWLEPGLIAQCANADPLPRAISSLEGGANKAVKGLLSSHHGLPAEHARRAAEWKLNSVTTRPSPWSLVRAEHQTPPKKPEQHQSTTSPSGPPLAPDSAGKTATASNTTGLADHAHGHPRHTIAYTHFGL